MSRPRAITAIVVLLLAGVALWLFEVLAAPFAARGVTWPSRPNVDPYGRWYGWPWHPRMRGGRLYRAERWLLGKRWDAAVAALGRDRARPFDFVPF